MATSVEITALAGGAVDPGLDHVAAAFRKETGHTVKIAYNLGAQGIKRMDEGEIFDVVVQPEDTLEIFFRAHGNVEDGGVSIGRVGLGVMARPAAPVPDISSMAAFRRAILEADAILYTTATSGRYIEEMLGKMGLLERTAAKTTRYPHGPELMERVLSGSGKELAFLPVSFIRKASRERGMVLVGPVPEEVQHYLDFIVVPSVRSTHKDVAWAFAHFCGGPGKPLLAAQGLT